MKVFYLCDGLACKDKYTGKCPMDPCKHTSDIAHSINFIDEVDNPAKDERFKQMNESYFERRYSKMADKTKDQLKQEIEALQSQLKEKQQEDIYNEPAKQLAMMKKAFIDNGFTEEQAYELTITLVRNQGNVNVGFSPYARGGLVK
jgi:hypothetical protein